MFKKKYPGGSKLFLSLLFIMLLGLSSTSYAVTTLNDNEVDYIIDNSFTYNPTENLYNNLWFYNDGNRPSTQFNLTNFKAIFKNSFNSYNILDFNNSFQDFFGYWTGYKDGNTYYLRFYYTNNVNYGKFGSKPHLYLFFNSKSNNSYVLSIRFIDDNKNLVTNTGNAFEFTTTDFNSFTFIRFYDYNAPSTSINNELRFLSSSNWNIDNISNSKLENINGIINFSNTNSVYTNFDGVNFYQDPFSRLFQTNYIGGGTIPDNPDTPIPDTGNTGTITNSSGETTGSIDLSGIQSGLINIKNQISGDTQKIIDNQNQNTEQIVNAIGSANEDFWGSSEDLTGDDEQQQIEDSLNDIIDSVSGELTNNAVFNHLEQAEDIFLGFFKNKEDESYYDLIISWDSISPIFTMFNGTQNIASGSIISGDSLNISALCRENQELAKIQQYIRIIFNFSVFMALIWQIYNLILSTLGIDNPYLYEDAQVNDVVNPETGEVRTYYRTRKRVFWRR